jgi:hypothetical protein
MSSTDIWIVVGLIVAFCVCMGRCDYLAGEIFNLKTRIERLEKQK